MSDMVAHCPRCDRTVKTTGGRYNVHALTHKSWDRCPMTNQVVPDLALDEQAWDTRAHIVADLAVQVQDADPSVVDEVLTSMPAGEVQRLLIVALAAIPVDRTLGELFSWVWALPIARELAS